MVTQDVDFLLWQLLRLCDPSDLLQVCNSRIPWLHCTRLDCIILCRHPSIITTEFYEIKKGNGKFSVGKWSTGDGGEYRRILHFGKCTTLLRCMWFPLPISEALHKWSVQDPARALCFFSSIPQEDGNKRGRKQREGENIYNRLISYWLCPQPLCLPVLSAYQPQERWSSASCLSLFWEITASCLLSSWGKRERGKCHLWAARWETERPDSWGTIHQEVQFCNPY